jgi:hypothetical protein
MIDARYNKISEINLSKPRFLQELLLTGNCISDLSIFIEKTRNLKELKVLGLGKNNASLESDYQEVILAVFPQLEILDGRRMKTRKDIIVQPLNLVVRTGLSSADKDLIKKSNNIQKKRLLADGAEMDRMSAVAQKQKEDFDAAKMRAAPIPEGLDFLGKSMRVSLPKNKQRAENSRSNSRLFLKRPVYSDKIVLSDVEIATGRMCPNTPAMFKSEVRMERIFG